MDWRAAFRRDVLKAGGQAASSRPPEEGQAQIHRPSEDGRRLFYPARTRRAAQLQSERKELWPKIVRTR